MRVVVWITEAGWEACVETAAALAPAGAAIARAEGFEAHAASMEARRENPRS